MRRVSPQTVIFAVLCALTAAVLGACIIEPIGYTKLLEDEAVLEIIEKSKGKVNIITEKQWPEDFSDPGLIAGNGKISGLNPDKYYIIEEWIMEEGEEPASQEDFQFVKSDGTRSPNLTDIGKVSGGTITELTNGLWYRVKSAKPLQGTANLYDQSAEPPPLSATPDSIPIDSDGIISLPPPNNDYYLNLPATLINFGSSDIVKIPIPGGQAEIIEPFSGNTIALEKGTETDYIFAEKEADYGTFSPKFHILKVNIAVPTTANVTVIFSLADGAVNMTVSANKITQASFMASGLTLTVSGAPPGATFAWRYDGVVVGSANPLTIPYTDDSTGWAYIVPGVHWISIEITTEMGVFSKEFGIEIAIQ